MRFDILSIFPNMFEGPFREGLTRIAQEKGLATIAVHNLRDYTTDKHRTTDDYAYGGGTGMVTKAEPLFRAVEAILSISEPYTAEVEEKGTKLVDPVHTRIILLTPQGRPFNQEKAQDLASCQRLILICGRYEGVDERVREHLATDEISIGDYVLSGGEIPAMVVVDAVARLLPGVLDEEAVREESFSAGLLEYPHYTRPEDFRGWKVPTVLLSGNHAVINRWRRLQALLRTRTRRPDLWQKVDLTAEDWRLLRDSGTQE